MRQDIRDAFEATVDAESKRPTSIVRREATLFMKRVEALIENMPDQTMTLMELHQEIAGEACRG